MINCLQEPTPGVMKLKLEAEIVSLSDIHNNTHPSASPLFQRDNKSDENLLFSKICWFAHAIDTVTNKAPTGTYHNTFIF